MKNSVSSLKHLEDWFREQDASVWTLYHGKQNKASSSSSKWAAKQHDEDMDIDDSWELLKKNLLRFIQAEGGTFTVFVRDKVKNTASGCMMYIDLESSQAKAYSQIHGLPGGQVDAATLSGLVEKKATEKTQQAIRQYDLERRLEDARQQLAAQEEGGFVERLFRRYAENGSLDRILELLLIRLMPQNQQRMLQMSGFGQQQESTGQRQPETDGQDNNSEGEEDRFVYDHERLVPILDRIRPYVPDIYDAMEKLAILVERDPQMALTILNQVRDEQ